MAITLAKLCGDIEKKYNMYLVAGKGGMGNVVRWVHMVEDREVPEFLHGGELIFTTGIGQIDNSELLNFVKGLKEHNAVGLVVNIGPYIKEIPKNVVEYCENNMFPLFTLPWNIYIIDITYDFCRRIMDNEKSETSAVEAFKSLIAHPEQTSEYVSVFDKTGFKVINCYTVLTLSFSQNNKDFTSQLYMQNHNKLWTVLAKSQNPSAMFMLDSRLVVIRQNFSEVLMEQINQRLDRMFENSGIKYSVGISETERGYQAVPQLLHEADSAHTVAKFNGKKMMYYSDIGVNKILFGVENKSILAKYTDEHLEKIIKYDKENGTDLIKWLREYLDNDGSIKKIADKNNVHRNTVNGKIKQIKEVFDLDMSGEEKMELMLAFKIKDIIGYIK